VAKISVTLCCHLLIPQDALKKIMKLDIGNRFPIRIRTGCIPSLVRLVTASVIVDVYLIKCLILNVYNKASVLYIYIYIISHNI